MRKYVTILLSLGLCGSILIGCGSAKKDNAPTDTTDTEQTVTEDTDSTNEDTTASDTTGTEDTASDTPDTTEPEPEKSEYDLYYRPSYKFKQKRKDVGYGEIVGIE